MYIHSKAIQISLGRFLMVLAFAVEAPRRIPNNQPYQAALWDTTPLEPAAITGTLAPNPSSTPINNPLAPYARCTQPRQQMPPLP
jgi:hypothetical protein